MEANDSIGNESEDGDGDLRNADYESVGVDNLSSMLDLDVGDECPLPTDDAGVDHFRKTRQMGPESLLDVLYGLAKLSDIKRRNAKSEGTVGDGSFRPLAVATCRAIVSDDEGASYVTKLWHSSLVETVWSLAVLDLRDETVLLDAIGNRLEKGDAFGKLTGKQLLTMLWSHASLGRDRPSQLRSYVTSTFLEGLQENSTR